MDYYFSSLTPFSYYCNQDDRLGRESNPKWKKEFVSFHAILSRQQRQQQQRELCARSPQQRPLLSRAVTSVWVYVCLCVCVCVCVCVCGVFSLTTLSTCIWKQQLLYSCTHTQKHTHNVCRSTRRKRNKRLRWNVSFSQSYTYTLTLSLFLFLTHRHTHTLTLSLSLSHTYSPSLSLSFSFSFSHIDTHTLTLSLPLSHKHIHRHTLTLSLFLLLTHSNSLWYIRTLTRRHFIPRYRRRALSEWHHPAPIKFLLSSFSCLAFLKISQEVLSLGCLSRGLCFLESPTKQNNNKFCVFYQNITYRGFIVRHFSFD